MSETPEKTRKPRERRLGTAVSQSLGWLKDTVRPQEAVLLTNVPSDMAKRLSFGIEQNGMACHTLPNGTIVVTKADAPDAPEAE